MLLHAPPGSDGGTLELQLAAAWAKGAVKLATYPAVAAKISALTASDDFSLAELSRLIAGDQALSADMLRVANSAAYWSSAPVTSVKVAVSRMGVREVSALALASSLGVQVSAVGPLASLRRRIWQEGLTSATLCQRLAPLRQQSAEEAFTCGLLHDFGRIAVVSALEQVLIAWPQPTSFGEAVLSAIVDRHHVAFGAALAARWQLAGALIEVMTLHHEPVAVAGAHPELLDLVRLSDQIVALATTAASVSAADLARLAGLRNQAEREAAALALTLCPALIASFEGSAPAQPAREAGLADAVVTEPSADRLTSVEFELFDQAQPKLPYRATAIGPNVLVLTGPNPLAVNRLARFEFQLGPDAIALWLNPQRCERSSKDFRIEAKPFALTKEAQRAWGGLLNLSGARPG